MNGLLTIDARAHLAKITTCYFSSPAVYPVELVRNALRRGARKIDITSEPGFFRLEDDGSPIPCGELTALAGLTGGRLAPSAAETAIAGFLDGKGIGLLALFAPRPECVEIETGSRTWRFPEREDRPAAAPRSRGNVMWLRRDKGYRREEEEYLRENCRFVSIPITINGHLLDRESAAADALVSIPISRETGGCSGTLWIPRRHMNCRLWLLDHGVIWKRKVFPPLAGGVWEAAVESPFDISETALEGFRQEWRRLYTWLIHHYSRFSRRIRDRVDELIFHCYQSVGDQLLLADFRPFRDLSGARGHTLAEVRGWPVIAAVPAEEAEESTVCAETGLLSLTPRQRDFLVLGIGLDVQLFPVAELAAPPSAWRRILARVQGDWQRRRLRTGSRPNRVIPEEAWTEVEKRFVALLEARLRKKVGEPVILSLVAGSARYAVFHKKNGQGWRIGLARDHHWIRIMIRKAASDPDHLEWITAWLQWCCFLRLGNRSG